MRILSVSRVFASPPPALSAQNRLRRRPSPAPPDVAAPPANATKTPSGLATRVSAPGKGTDHPAKDDVVTIHYTGWKTDGKMFDSSVAKGKPASFPVGRVIAGFSEGLQLMVPGEKRRLWIPGGARLQGRARAEGHAGVRHRADRHPDARAGRRQGAAGRREDDRERPRLQGAAARASADAIRGRPAR